MPVVAMGSPLPTEGQRENRRDLAQHAPEDALEGLPPGAMLGPCGQGSPSRLAVGRAVPQGVGDLAEGGPVLGAEGPATLHQPIELGGAAFGLWEPRFPGLQICGRVEGST